MTYIQYIPQYCRKGKKLGLSTAQQQYLSTIQQRLASNEIHREVGRAKDLPTPMVVLSG